MFSNFLADNAPMPIVSDLFHEDEGSDAGVEDGVDVRRLLEFDFTRPVDGNRFLEEFALLPHASIDTDAGEYYYEDESELYNELVKAKTRAENTGGRTYLYTLKKMFVVCTGSDGIPWFERTPSHNCLRRGAPYASKIRNALNDIPDRVPEAHYITLKSNPEIQSKRTMEIPDLHYATPVMEVKRVKQRSKSPGSAISTVSSRACTPPVRSEAPEEVSEFISRLSDDGSAVYIFRLLLPDRTVQIFRSSLPATLAEPELVGITTLTPHEVRRWDREVEKMILPEDYPLENPHLEIRRRIPMPPEKRHTRKTLKPSSVGFCPGILEPKVPRVRMRSPPPQQFRNKKRPADRMWDSPACPYGFASFNHPVDPLSHRVINALNLQVVNDSENHPLPVLSTVDPTLGPCQSSFDDCFGPFQSRFEADDFYLPAAKRFRAREVLPAGGGLLGGTQSLCNDVSAVEDERRVKRRKVIFNNSKEEIMPIKGETENIEAPSPTLSRNNLTTGPCSRWSARDFGTIISPGDPRRYRWIEFDDQVVRAWNPLGGNEDEPDFRAKLFTSDTAYMLLYKRTDVPAGRDCTLPTGLQEFVDTLTRDHVEKETLYEDRSTVIKQVYSTAKKNTSRFIPRVNTATQQLRREWDSMTKGENAVLRAKVLQERILPKLSCVPRLWWSAMTQGDEGTSLCAAYEPWRRNDLVIIQDASNPFSAQLTTVDMRQDRPDWGPLSVDEKWLCAHRLGAAPAHVTEGSFRFVPKTVFEPWPVLSAVKEDSDASSADESQSIRIHPGMSIQALARMSVPQALCERCSEIMLAAASVSSRMLSVLEEVIKSVTRNGGTSSPSDSDSTAKSLHLHGSYYVSRKALTRLQGALTPPDPIKGGPGGHKSGNSRLSKNSRNSNGISELERQVAHIRAGMRLVRKDMRHLSQITQAGWDTTIQDKWIVPLTADLRCPHGQVMTSNGRVRGVWVASHLLEDLNQQDEVKAALLMEILGVFPELFPPRRLRLEADAPPTQAAHLAEEACEECLRDSSERTKEAKQTRKNRNLIRTMLPPGHFDMLMNPRYFMLTQALVRGRRNTIYLPAEGCHVIVPSSILSDWRRSSGVKGTTFATKPKLNSNFTKEDAMNAIETYFSGLAEYEMAKMAAWWTSSAFHSFNADVPIGGSSVMTSNPDNSDAPTATLAAASNGGYLVYIPTFHTQRDQMALIPLDTWENLITKDGNSAGLPQIAVRIERHEISGRKVFAASDDIELGVGSAGGPLRSLRLEILLPDVAVADISVLMRVPTAGLNTISGRHLTNQMGSSLVVMRGPAKTALMPLAVNTFHEYDFVATSFYLKEPGATT